MAARRLVVVMLVLLFVSSLAAALAPVQPVDEEPAEDPVTRVPSPPVAQDPELSEARLNADAEEPPIISVNAGDQLRLEVISRRSGTVELVGLGASEDVDRFSPALFDVFLPEADTYRVRFLGEKETLGTIEVKAPAPAAPEPPS